MSSFSVQFVDRLKNNNVFINFIDQYVINPVTMFRKKTLNITTKNKAILELFFL